MRRVLAVLIVSTGCYSSGPLIWTEPTPLPDPTPEPTPEPGEPDDDPDFDPPGHTFVDPFQLEIASDPPGHPILYTDDGSVPYLDSDQYDDPILVSQSRRFRAYVDYDFEVPDGEVDPGPDINTHGYFRLGADVADFTSNLPLMLIHTFETREIRRQDYFWVPAHAMVMEPDEQGTTHLLGVPTVDTSIGIQVRGSSTRNQPKHSYAFESWDAHDEDDSIEMMGLPKESDWVLFAPLRFDRALIRNPIAYELSNRVGRWAPRTRNIELFLVENRAERFHEDNYHGVYTLIEKIKPDANRVPIHRLTAEHTQLPEISGGYIFKIDRLGEDATGFVAGGSESSGRPLGLVYPDEEDVTAVQMAYLVSYLDDFAAALNAADHLHPTLGTHYSEWIDVPGWIDHHIINLFTKNPDGLRLSSYFHKPRGGKLVAGPVWDFDRTMGSRDGRDADPEGWNPGSGSGYWTAFWWNRLIGDPVFMDAYWARLDVLIQTELSPERLSDLVDQMAGELEEPAARNEARWPDYAHPQGHDAAVEHLRWWLIARSEWIAANIGSM